MRKIMTFLILILLGCLPVYADNPNKVELTPTNDQIWVHTTYYLYNGFPTPSNGLLAITAQGIILVDTPWTDEQTQELLRITKQKFGKEIVLAVITHAHTDRIGGIATLLNHHIETISTPLTAQFAEKGGYQRPQDKIDTDVKTFTVGDVSFETYYPGPAHTFDNIVVYFPKTRVLFGGCIVKSENATDLGNIAEGDVTRYPQTMQALMKRYPMALTVIPGHGNRGGFNLLKHTFDLASH